MKIIQGDALTELKRLPDESVQMCCTSPPYYSLRDYGLKPSGWPEISFSPVAALPMIKIPAMESALGLEKDPWAFVGHIVLIFREVRKVLKNDGTMWINFGDNYASGGNGGHQKPDGGHNPSSFHGHRPRQCDRTGASKRPPQGLKPKDLCMMPARIALALQADGWYLRCDIIWNKKNCMPESVRDRPTKNHEYIFLMSKSQKYYYDAEAIKEKGSDDTHALYARGRSANHKYSDGGPGDQTIARSLEHMVPGVNPKARDTGVGFGYADKNPKPRTKQNASFSAAVKDIVAYRNKRSVWDMATQPYSEAHFATFPEQLPKTCILAGSKPGDIILDPFSGSGTTGKVALELGRDYIGIELNPKFIKLHDDRISQIGLGI